MLTSVEIVIKCFTNFRYAIIYKKGYQEFDAVESSATTKLKGVVFTNFTNMTPEHDKIYNHRLFDVADYVVPPQVRVQYRNNL